MTRLPHQLDRTIVIRARREVVFSFFTDSERWASWWGVGSTIEARPGGRLLIRYPGGVEVSGEVVDVAPPNRLIFTYGFNSGAPIPPGASRVTIRLDPHEGGTRLTLTHEFGESDAHVRDEHVQGWRYQLSVFANVVSQIVGARATDLVDGWFRAWAEPNDDARAQLLASIATPAVRFGDRYSLVEGLADLTPHIAAAQRFMPGLRLERHGEVRHTLGTLLADWKAVGPDGAARGQGTNVFVLDADAKIESVTGFWS